MTDLSNVLPISEKDLAFLQGVDSPTISNAIEPFKVRDRTEGFIGGEVRALFPEMRPMIGVALTVTMTNTPGATAGRDTYWRMYEALSHMPAPSVLVVQDISGAPSRCALAGEVMTTMAMRVGAVGMVTDGACVTCTKCADSSLGTSPAMSSSPMATSEWSTSANR